MLRARPVDSESEDDQEATMMVFQARPRRGVDQPIGGAVTVEATQQPIGEAAAVDMIGQAHARQQEQMMVLQVNAIERSRKETIYRTLIDSGADTGGAYRKMLMATCNDRESDVGAY